MANGLLDLLGGLGTTPPQYLEGLLGAQQTEDLRKRSIGTGLANALVGYLAMPKNQNLGLGRILAGSAQAGLEGAKGVYTDATQDYLQQQKIEEMNRVKRQREAYDTAFGGLYKTTPAQYENVSTSGGYAPQQSEIATGQMSPNFGMQKLPDVVTQREIAPARSEINQDALMQLVASGDPRATEMLGGLKLLGDLNKPKERKTQTVGNKIIDLSEDTPRVIFEGDKEAKALPTYTVDRNRVTYTIQVQPDMTEKVIGVSAKDAPQQAEKLSYKTEPGADGKMYYIPTKPGNPILDTSGRPTDAYKPAGAKPTADERKANTLLTRMEGSLAQLNQAVSENPSAAKPEYLPEAIKAITFGANAPANAVTSSERQRAEAAQLDIVDAALTLGTGAAYTKEQLEGYRRSYFPQLGDSDAQVADKAARRENLISAARVAANRNPNSQPTTPSPPARSKADILKQYGL